GSDVCSSDLNVYGPSETTVWVSRSDVTAARHRPVSIGEPVDGSRLHLLDERLCPVGMGELGEIFIGGRQVGAGYWRDPVLTAASFLPEPGEGVARRMYGTGDTGRRYPHGIVLLGRADDQVKVRGNRVELSDVEAALRDLPYVDDAVCLATAGGTGEVEIVAACVTSAPERSIQRDLK